MSDLESLREELSCFTGRHSLDSHHGILDSLREGSGEAVNIASKVVDFYKQWEPALSSASPAIEIFAPTLLGTHGERPLLSIRNVDDNMVERWISGILHLSLYVDKIWIPDPIELLAHSIIDDAESMGQISIHLPLMEDFSILVLANSFINVLQPLIEQKIVCLYPAITTYNRWVAMELFGENRFFSERELKDSWPELYVAEGLLYARKFGASYTALHSDEFHALTFAATEASESAGLTSQRIVAALPRMKLPFFRGIGPEVLAKARINESHFNDFRNLLRETVNTLPGGLDDPDFDQEIVRLERDHLTPELKRLYEQINGTAALKSHISEAGIDFTAGAIGGTLLTSDLKGAALVGSTSVLLKLLIKIFANRSKPRPAASIIYAFHTEQHMSMDSGFNITRLTNHSF